MLEKGRNLLLFSALLLIYSCIEVELKKTIDHSLIISKNWRRRSDLKRFLFYKSNNINERACECSTMQSCNCCETVILLFMKTQKRLCANIIYQRNGLNVDISLDSDTIRTLTITNFRPINICTQIPGSLFSRVCLNLVELNAFSRSLTVCPRFTISSKHQEWRISYTCVSISTELPAANETTPEPGPAVTVGMPGGSMSGMIMVSMNGEQTMSPEGMDSSTLMPAEGMADSTMMPTEEMGESTMMPAGGNGARPEGMGPPPGGMRPPSGGMGPPAGDNGGAVSIEPARLAALKAPDRAKYFPSRLPPALAAYYANYSSHSFG